MGIFVAIGIVLAFLGLIAWLIATSRADAVHEWENGETKRTMQKNREQYKNAENIYTRPRASVDDVIDGL